MKKLLILFLIMTSQFGIGQIIPSVPLTGTPSTGTVPDGWTMVELSSDMESLPTVPIWGWAIDPEGLVGLPPEVDRIVHTHCLDHYGPSVLKGEAFGIAIPGLTIGESYTFHTWTAGTKYSGAMPVAGDVHTSLWVGESVADIIALGDTPTVLGRDVSIALDWELEEWTFTATATTMWIVLGVSSESYRDYSHTGALWALIDNELSSDDCDDLVTTVSATEVCDGDEITLEASSIHGGTVTWDGGVVDGEAFAPPVGTTTYTATSDHPDDCIFSVTITVHELPDVTATVDDDMVCLGDFITLSGTGAESYTWDMGAEDGVAFETTELGVTTYTVTGTDENGCENTDEIDVTVTDIPTAHFEFIASGVSSEDGGTGGCIVNPVQFNDLSTILDPETIVSWDWDFGDGGSSDEENPEHTYGSAGTYTVTLTVETENGCTATVSIDIIMTESLTLDIISNDPTCFGFSDGSITVNVTGGAGDLVFEIKNDLGDLMNEDNSNTANTLPTGTYTIIVSDGTECSGEATVFLDQPDEINADLTVVDPLCYGDASGWVRVDSVYNATGLYDQISFFWAPNPPNHEGLGADSLWDLYAGDYTLTINDENGCSRVFDFVVDQPDSMHFVEFGFEHAYCRMFGYQSGNGVVYGAAAGGTPDYTYLWENLDNGDTEITSTWGGLNPANYRLTATDENGCVISREIFLDSLNPEAAFTVISDQLNTDCQGTAPVEVEFENNSINFYNENDPFGDSTFFWNLNSPNGDWQLTHDYFYKPDTTYLEKNNTYEVEVCLVALNKNGCSDTACKIITVYKPIAFEDINIFTPNGDGNNDIFTFEFRAASISEFHCVIVNRWGVVMKELNDISEGWDGTDQGGNPCKDGVYFYVYEAVTDNNNTITGQGNIQLVAGN